MNNLYDVNVSKVERLEYGSSYHEVQKNVSLIVGNYIKKQEKRLYKSSKEIENIKEILAISEELTLSFLLLNLLCSNEYMTYTKWYLLQVEENIQKVIEIMKKEVGLNIVIQDLHKFKERYRGLNKYKLDLVKNITNRMLTTEEGNLIRELGFAYIYENNEMLKISYSDWLGK